MSDAERKAADEEIRKIIRSGARHGNDGAIVAFATLEAADKIVAALDGIGRPLYVPYRDRRKSARCKRTVLCPNRAKFATPHKS